MSYQPNNPNGQATMANSAPVVVASNQSAIPVAGAFYQATQPVSIATMPSTPVTGTFWQATQPVSIAASVAVTGTFWQATQPVSIASVPTHAVTQSGTWTTTASGVAANGSAVGGNPVLIGGSDGTNARTLSTTTTGAINIADGGNSITVDGTVGVSGSVAVTGTFWQATQPVSIASMPTTPVTGTFWQATQPVSGTVELGATSLAALENISVTVPGTVDLGTVSLTALETITVTQPTAANFQATATQALGSAATRWYTQLSDGTNSPAIKAASTAAAATDPSLVVSISPNNSVAVTGTFWQATQPVSLASLPALAAGSNAIGSITNTSFAVTQATGTNLHTVVDSGTITTVSAVTAITNALPAGTNAIGKLAANAGVIIGAVELASSTTNTNSNASTTAYAASLVAKASAGVLYMLSGYNSKSTGQFIQLHDSATLPADTAVPKVIFYVPATSNFSFDLSAFGRSFSNGIVICNSSTGPTKTIGTADCWFDVQYK